MFGMYPGLKEKKNKSKKKKIKSNSKQTAFIVFAVVVLLIFCFPPIDYHNVEYLWGGKAFDDVKFAGFGFIFDIDRSYRVNFPIWIIEFILTGLIYVGYLKTRD